MSKKEQTKKLVNEFIEKCEKTLESYVIKDTEIKLHGVKKYKLGRSRYNDYLGWYHIDLPEELDLNAGYEDACAIHIKPYCITRKDIEDAQNSRKSKFAVEVEKDISFIDYDPQSGNYHKAADGNLQIVIVRKNSIGKNRFKYGPGWLDDTLESVKEDWYFPRPSENKPYADITKILNDFFEKVLYK